MLYPPVSRPLYMKQSKPIESYNKGYYEKQQTDFRWHKISLYKTPPILRRRRITGGVFCATRCVLTDKAAKSTEQARFLLFSFLYAMMYKGDKYKSNPSTYAKKGGQLWSRKSEPLGLSSVTGSLPP